MEVKHKWIWIVVISVVVIAIGGKLYMDKKSKENQQNELYEVQEDLANYLYNNYEIYTKDEEKVEEGKIRYNKGEGESTEKEYLTDMKNSRIYSDIRKVEFTGFTTSPMKGLVVKFIINDVYPDETTLSTISAETDKFVYYLNSGNDINGYILIKKEIPTSITPSKDLIIYYDGGID